MHQVADGLIPMKVFAAFSLSFARYAKSVVLKRH